MTVTSCCIVLQALNRVRSYVCAPVIQVILCSPVLVSAYVSVRNCTVLIMPCLGQFSDNFK